MDLGVEALDVGIELRHRRAQVGQRRPRRVAGCCGARFRRSRRGARLSGYGGGDLLAIGAQLRELLLIGRVGLEVGLAVSVRVGKQASRRSEPVTNLPMAGKPLLQVRGLVHPGLHRSDLRGFGGPELVGLGDELLQPREVAEAVVVGEGGGLLA